MSVSEPTHTKSRDRTPAPDDPDSTPLRDGLIGGGVAVLLAVLPLSTVLGGAVAGYLNGHERRHGAAAGLVAGLVAFLPYTVAGTLLVLSPATTLPGPAVDPAVLVTVVAGWAVVYVLGLCALGGVVGASVRRRRD